LKLYSEVKFERPKEWTERPKNWGTFRGANLSVSGA